MGKTVHNNVLDGALNIIVNSVSHMTAHDTEPTLFAHSATSAICLASMVAGDFTVGDGDTNGRKVEVGSKGNITVDFTDDANHVAMVNSNDGQLLYVTTATSQALTAANIMNFQSWDIEIADPT